MMIAFNQLKYGHDATPPINARMTGRDTDIEQLAASLIAHGQIHPLTVKVIDGVNYVADGNRRLAAFALLIKTKKLKATDEIACTIVDETQSAHELSLAANELRIGLHEADSYLSFKDLNKNGLGVDEIALRFGTSKLRVRRMLAIGNLSPAIISAWRSGEIDGRTVKAFTLSEDTVEQERVFHHLSQQGHVSAHRVETAFGASDQAVRKNINLVTVEKYVSAGGGITEDLFGDAHVIHDQDLLQKLANDVLNNKVSELEKDGWSWVSLMEGMPSGWKSHWEQISVKNDKFTTEHKATAGAVVGRDYNGLLEITLGVLKPKKAKPAASASTSAPDDPTSMKLSDALNERLAVQATSAIKTVLEKDQHAALAAVLASFLCRHSSVLRISRSDQRHDLDRENFEVLFERFKLATISEMLDQVALIAGETLYLWHQQTVRDHIRSPFIGAGRALVDGLDKSETYAALCKHFDAEDYFKSISRDQLIAVIGEALGDDHVRRVSDLKKPELVKYAVANIPDSGWLPSALRTSSYPGRGE